LSWIYCWFCAYLPPFLLAFFGLLVARSHCYPRTGVLQELAGDYAESSGDFWNRRKRKAAAASLGFEPRKCPRSPTRLMCSCDTLLPREGASPFTWLPR